MRDSDTYMAILEEGIEKGAEKGRIEEAKKLVFRLAHKKLGAPGKKAAATLDALTNLERLELLAERVGDVKTWKELLADK